MTYLLLLHFIFWLFQNTNTAVGNISKAEPVNPVYYVIVTAIVTGAFGLVGSYFAYLYGKPKLEIDIKKTTHEMLHTTQEDLGVWVERFNKLAEKAYDLEDDYEEITRLHKHLVYDVKAFFEDAELLFEECDGITDYPSYSKMRRAIDRIKLRYKFDEHVTE